LRGGKSKIIEIDKMGHIVRVESGNLIEDRHDPGSR